MVLGVSAGVLGLEDELLVFLVHFCVVEKGLFELVLETGVVVGVDQIVLEKHHLVHLFAGLLVLGLFALHLFQVCLVLVVKSVLGALQASQFVLEFCFFLLPVVLCLCVLGL